jgi:hypothetical protein
MREDQTVSRTMGRRERLPKSAPALVAIVGATPCGCFTFARRGRTAGPQAQMTPSVSTRIDDSLSGLPDHYGEMDAVPARYGAD